MGKVEYDKDEVQLHVMRLEREALRQVLFVGEQPTTPLYFAVQEDTGEPLVVLVNRATGRLAAYPYGGNEPHFSAGAFPPDCLYGTAHVAAQPGDRFLHYKGGVYRWLGLAARGDRVARPLVIYRSELKGSCWARTIDDWCETIPPLAPGGKPVQRFIPLEEATIPLN